jgi:PAS domain S-box-containing protein
MTNQPSVSHLADLLAGDELQGLRTLKQALDAAPDGVVITDQTRPDAPIVYANPAFERISGYPASEILGRNCRFLQGDDREQAGVSSVREAVEKAEEATVVLRNYRKDGTPFWNRLHLAPVFNTEGAVTHFVGIQEDITREREEAAAREQLLEIVEATPDLVMVIDSDGRILYLNQGGPRSLDLAEAAAQAGQSFEALHPDWAVQRLREEGFPTAIQEGYWQGRTAVVTEAGEEIPVSQVLLAHYGELGGVKRLSAILRNLQRGEENSESATGEAMYRQIVEAAREGFDRIRQQEAGTPFRKLPVDSGGAIQFLDPDRVRFFQAEGNYALAFTDAGHHLVNLSLAELERRLGDQGFVRSHRSYLVQLDHIQSFTTLDGQTYLVMDTPHGDRVPVSRRNLDPIRSALGIS